MMTQPARWNRATHGVVPGCIPAPLRSLLRPDRPLLVAHRGVGGGGVVENTLGATLAAIASGADLVELDVVSSVDGEYFVFHDGYEQRWFGDARPLTTMRAAEIAELRYPESQATGVQRLDALLAETDVVVNLDRSWRYWPHLLPWLDVWADPECLLMKVPADAPALAVMADHPVPYPLLIVARDLEQIDTALAIPGLRIVGVELVFDTPEHPFADPAVLEALHESGLLTYVNALDLGDGRPLAAGWDDTTSLIAGPAQGWGQLLDRGYDLIQTDWPWLLGALVDERSRGR